MSPGKKKKAAKTAVKKKSTAARGGASKSGAKRPAKRQRVPAAESTAIETRPNLEKSRPDEPGFVPEVLDKTVIAIPLLDDMAEERERITASRRRRPRPDEFRKLYDVIIDVNLEYPRGRALARARVRDLITVAIAVTPWTRGTAGSIDSSGDRRKPGINEAKTRLSDAYIFASLSAPMIEALVRLDNRWAPKEEPGSEEVSRDVAPPVTDAVDSPVSTAPGRRRRVAPEESERGPSYRAALSYLNPPRAIHHIWPDFPIRPLLTKTVSTVKADAARTAFGALGGGIVWAVIDSGIDGNHPHFAEHSNLVLEPPVVHRDFTGAEREQPLVDGFEHGTHVAGIIAGELDAKGKKAKPIRAVTRYRDEHGKITREVVSLTKISGIAPMCKLVSFKVLDDRGNGTASNIIAALEEIQRINGHGKRLLIHGVNLSVGYDFEPEWFGCGQSPLCIEVDRLVRSGVVVVVAAGNTGFGFTDTAFTGVRPAGLQLSINDPGNAALGITVGSTHRDMPHTYGISYFSSKGPTGDGRL